MLDGVRQRPAGRFSSKRLPWPGARVQLRCGRRARRPARARSPARGRCRESSRDQNGRKIRSCSVRAMPGPVSSTATETRPFCGAELELDPAAVGRPAERVREQVGDDLQHAVAVRDDRRRSCTLACRTRSRAVAPPRRTPTYAWSHEPPMSTSSSSTREPVRLELGEVEHVADEPLEALALAARSCRATRARDLRIVDDALRAAPRHARGSRSAACAARARRSSGSCAPAALPPPAGRPSRGSGRRGARSRRRLAPRAPRRRSVRARSRRSPPRARAPAA